MIKTQLQQVLHVWRCSPPQQQVAIWHNLSLCLKWLRTPPVVKEGEWHSQAGADKYFGLWILLSNPSTTHLHRQRNNSIHSLRIQGFCSSDLSGLGTEVRRWCAAAPITLTCSSHSLGLAFYCGVRRGVRCEGGVGERVTEGSREIKRELERAIERCRVEGAALGSERSG